MDVDVILENYPITIVIHNLLVYSTIQCSTIVIILDDSKCHRTIMPQYIMSYSVVHNKNVKILQNLQHNVTFSFYDTPICGGHLVQQWLTLRYTPGTNTHPGNVSCWCFTGESAHKGHTYNGLVPRQLLAYITRPHSVESSAVGTVYRLSNLAW